MLSFVILFFFLMALPFAGALVARLCLERVVHYLQRNPIDWDTTLLWGCGLLAGLFVPVLLALVVIVVSGAGMLGLLAVFLAVITGLLAPELWTGFSAWIRDPRHLARAVSGLALVAGAIIILLNWNSVLALLAPLLVLGVVLLGLAMMLRPLIRLFR